MTHAELLVEHGKPKIVESAKSGTPHSLTRMHASSSPRRWRAALAGVAATALAGCGTVTEAEGRAVNQAGQPVRGALVLLRRAGRPPEDALYAQRTDSAGRFHAILYGFYFPPDAVLSVCAPGFAPEERQVDGGGMTRGVAVALKPGLDAGPLCRVPPGLAVVE